MDEIKSPAGPHDEALNDPVLSVLFTELRAVADRPAPPVDTELAAVLAGAIPLAVARDQRSRTARTAIIGLVTTGILAGGLGAAAANELPPPAQRIVSKVVNGLTPFNIPNPDEQGPVEHQPDTTIDDDDDQPGQDGTERDGTERDGTERDGTERGGTEQGDQGDGQGDGQDGQDGRGDQSGGDQPGDQQTDGSGDQGVSDDADQQGSGEETTGGTTGGSGDTGEAGNGSGGSGTNGDQPGTNGSGQN
ncbi:hypothetical protein [Nocardioides sp. S5]|uniref:hypothetical protein n=1 Tax=Nocardioides sp. S5 TaxID=2017486 RepID=UPI001A8E7E7D|nr:hypothetical protein [Nocardioides sp. S5]